MPLSLWFCKERNERNKEVREEKERRWVKIIIVTNNEFFSSKDQIKLIKQNIPEPSRSILNKHKQLKNLC